MPFSDLVLIWDDARVSRLAFSSASAFAAVVLGISGRPVRCCGTSINVRT